MNTKSWGSWNFQTLTFICFVWWFKAIVFLNVRYTFQNTWKTQFRRRVANRSLWRLEYQHLLQVAFSVTHLLDNIFNTLRKCRLKLKCSLISSYKTARLRTFTYTFVRLKFTTSREKVFMKPTLKKKVSQYSVYKQIFVDSHLGSGVCIQILD